MVVKRPFNKKPTFNSQEPPSSIIEYGRFCHPCQGQLVCARIVSQMKIPFFNANIYLKNKSQIGRVDEILGPLNELYFTVKPLDGIMATSFTAGDTLYISPDKLLPLERFLPKPAVFKPLKPLNMQGKVQKKKHGAGAGFNANRGPNRPGQNPKMNNRGGNQTGRGRGYSAQAGRGTNWKSNNAPRGNSRGPFNKFKGSK